MAFPAEQVYKHLVNKTSAILGLAERAIKYREEETKKARYALLLNDYPITVINKIFKRRKVLQLFTFSRLLCTYK